MGMYSELVLGVQLKPTTPKEVIQILENLCGKDGNYGFPANFEAPYHPFFKSEKAENIFAYWRNSFDSIPGSSLTYEEYYKGYVLTVRAHLKNYDLEYENFLDWIASYCQTEEKIPKYIGYIHYEDWYTPNLIFIYEGQIWMAQITITSQGYDFDGWLSISDGEDIVPGELPNQLKIRGFITLKEYIKRIHG